MNKAVTSSLCCGLDVCTSSPSQSVYLYVEGLIPSVIVFGGGAFGRYTGLEEVVKVDSHDVLRKSGKGRRPRATSTHPPSLSLHPTLHLSELPCCHPDLRLPSTRMVRNTSMLSLCYFF